MLARVPASRCIATSRAKALPRPAHLGTRFFGPFTTVIHSPRTPARRVAHDRKIRRALSLHQDEIARISAFWYVAKTREDSLGHRDHCNSSIHQGLEHLCGNGHHSRKATHRPHMHAVVERHSRHSRTRDGSAPNPPRSSVHQPQSRTTVEQNPFLKLDR